MADEVPSPLSKSVELEARIGRLEQLVAELMDGQTLLRRQFLATQAQLDHLLARLRLDRS